MTPQQAKAIAIAQSIIDTAYSIADGFKTPIANTRLLKKRPFPDRHTPHPLKRNLKRQARIMQAKRSAIMVAHAAMGYSRVQTILSQPSPKYTNGGVVQETGPEVIIR